MASEAGTPALDVDDIQSLVLRRRPTPYVGCHVLLHFSDPSQGREFLRRLQPHIISAAQVEAADTWVAVALTYTGLQALGVPQASLDSFPAAFREGMAARAAGFETCPENLPPWVDPYGTGRVHAWLTLLCVSADAFKEKLQVAEQQLQDLPGVQILARDDYEQASGMTPFGYLDGISFPQIRGNVDNWFPSQNERPVEPGEFVLGYPGEQGRVVPVPTPDVLGRNGTFLGFRKLHSKVAAFRRFLRDNAAALGISPELLAAKLIGRWPRTGAPLVLAPDAETPLGADQINNFTYASDPNGLRCPMGAHIRRMNPRDTTVQVLTDVTIHRILRHGTAYGPPLPDGVMEDDGQARGMFFIFMSATAPDTYEFLKKNWIDDGNFLGLGNERDPIAGSHDGHGQFTLPRRPLRRKITLPQNFVQVLGGEYAFMPSLSALRWISALPQP